MVAPRFWISAEEDALGARGKSRIKVGGILEDSAESIRCVLIGFWDEV